MATGIENLNYLGDGLKLSRGNHVCVIYSIEHERRASVSKFVADALAQDDMFLYVADESTESVLEWLKCAHKTEDVNSNQFSIADAKQVYCPCGTFFPNEMIASIRELYQTAKSRGFQGFSGTGEMSWVNHGWPGSERLIEYELLLNDLVLNYAPTILCQYNVNLFDGGTILDVLRVHPMTLINGQMVKNPFFRSTALKSTDMQTSPILDNKILAELMLVQGLLHVFPSERKISEFVCKAVRSIPGFNSCQLRFQNSGWQVDLEQEDNHATNMIQTEKKPEAIFNSGEDIDDELSFPLSTVKRTYGKMVVGVHDNAIFDIYEPYIHTLANSLAITFENRFQERELNSEIRRHKATGIELQEANIQLKNLANTDALTGLYNRRYCFHKIPEEVLRSVRLKQTMVLVMIDINNFKQVNDRLGHDQGNRLLQAFSVITREELRTAIDFTFRIGGDEFAILMGDCTLEKANLACQRLDEQFCEQTEIASLAYGVVEIPNNLDRKEITADQIWLEHLMSIADQRMYKHKISYKSSRCDVSTSKATT